jgi:hypothetical protein
MVGPAAPPDEAIGDWVRASFGEWVTPTHAAQCQPATTQDPETLDRLSRIF